MIWLHRYTQLLAAATLLLLVAGGMVTSTQSGLAVPDWPTTYGHNMFAFPLEGMVGGIFYEHGHRLIASGVGLLTVGLAAWLWWVEPRAWVRRLGLVAVAAVILQGVLGGVTVLYLLPDAVSIGHAGLAQIYFGLVVALALFTSRSWRVPQDPPADDPRLARRMVWLTALVYVQILMGATMRHTGAGLAIPDFPLVYGGLLPPFWNFDIAIHFAHRIGALVVSGLAAAGAIHIWRRHRWRPELLRPAAVLLLAVATQVTLGAFVVLTGKQPIVNTLHVAGGALVLAASLVLALRASRARFSLAPFAVRPAARLGRTAPAHHA